MARVDSWGQKVKRHRNKDVACVSCDKPTRDTGALCNDCRALIKDGEAFRRAKGRAIPGGLERAPMVHYWATYHFRGNPESEKYDVAAVLRDSCIALAGAEIAYGYHAPAAWTQLPAAPSVEAIGGLARQDSLDYVLVAPKGKAELIQRVYQACVDLMAQAYKEGYSKGENMLARLADGELSMHDLQDKAARR